MIKTEIQIKGAPPNFDDMPKIVAEESREIARELGDEYRRSYARTLIAARKIATGDTLDSIEDKLVLYSPSRQLFMRQIVASRSIVFIIKGRAAGGKMPIRFVGTTKDGHKLFEPVPELLRWLEFLNIPSYFWLPIARAIARRGIKPVDIPGRALRRARPRLQSIVQFRVTRILKRLFNAR